MTWAQFVIAGGLPTSVKIIRIVALWPSASCPSWHRTPRAVASYVQVPREELTEWAVLCTLLGKVSVTITFCADSEPWFVTVRVKLEGLQLPLLQLPKAPVLTILTSAPGGLTHDRLLVELGSKVFELTCAQLVIGSPESVVAVIEIVRPCPAASDPNWHITIRVV